MPSPKQSEREAAKKEEDPFEQAKPEYSESEVVQPSPPRLSPE